MYIQWQFYNSNFGVASPQGPGHRKREGIVRVLKRTADHSLLAHREGREGMAPTLMEEDRQADQETHGSLTHSSEQS